MPLAAQVAAPKSVLDALSVRAATLQTLIVPAGPAGPFTVPVVIEGQRVLLQLRPHEVRAANFQLLVGDDNGLRPVPAPACNTYRGSVLGHGDSVVAAQVVHAELEALVLLDDEVWVVQPARRVIATFAAGVHVVFRGADTQVAGVRCGNTQVALPGGGAPAPASLVLKEADFAVDADYNYYTRYGSNVNNVQNQVTSIVNGVDAIYQRDTQITYKLTTVVVRTSPTYVNTNMSSLLGEFGSRWNGSHGSVVRDLAHLFTGKGSFSGVIGIAYLGVVCTSSAYGVSKAFSSNLYTNVGLVAHETGHNWNAPHCDSASPCNIMCSGLGGCSRNLSGFAPVSINSIVSFKNTRNCLANAASVPPTISAITPSTVKAWNGGTVTLTGTEFDTVTSVTVGGTPVTFQVLSATSLRLTLPNPHTIARHQVQAVNPKGPSNAVNLTVTGNHPSELVAPIILPRGIPFPFEVHTDAGWGTALLASSQLVPSTLPGIVSLGIGANFSDLFVVANLVADARGSASVTLTAPSSVQPGLILHWQAVTFMGSALPLEVSNTRSLTIF